MTVDDVDRVRRELDAALSTVSDLPASLSDPVLTDQCPPPPAGLVEGDLSPADVMLSGSGVDRPSDELVWVYLLPQAVYEAAFGGEQPYLLASAEYLCDGQHECVPVTTALYLSDAIDAETLGAVLLAGLNQRFLPRARQFELDDLEACDRGETPTYFRCDQLEGVREDLARALTPQLDD